ncbi:MAG: wax ester/triacylglycerol synthase family O-acyltransferase [Novosphingobium sp.]
MQQLSPQDAIFAYMETIHTPAQLAWFNIYDPATAPGREVRFEAILDHVARRLHTAPFYRQKLAFVPASLGEPYWVDDSGFDLEYHVRHVGLPPPGDWNQLCNTVARLFAHPFDLNKPLWEFYVIDGLSEIAGVPPGSFAILAKLHHAAIDGVSGVNVTTELHTPAADTPPPPPQVWQPEAEPRPVELLLRSYMANAAQPGRRIRTIARSIPSLRRAKAAVDSGEIRRPGYKVPRTRFAGPVGAHRSVDARRFRLEAIKPIRALVPGSTVNDVMLAIVGGTMRRYLQAKSELPDEPLVAACPISVRTAEQDGELGNQVGSMFTRLATDIADPVERLRRVRDDTANAKGFSERVGARTLTELSQIVPGVLVGLGMRLSSRLASGVANTTVTNVPGPQQPLFLAGAQVVTQFALGPLLPSLGIFHTVLSYCGELTLTVVADRDKLPDPEFYAECMQAAYDELIDVPAAAEG